MNPILEIIKKEFLNSNSTPNTSVDEEAEYVDLPSLGYFYSGNYKGIKRIKVRKLNGVDEILLATESYYRNNLLFPELLKNVIVDKDFPLEELVEVDKDTILYWLRIGAYGSKYEMHQKCSQCEGKVQKITWDFATLQFPDYPEECIKELQENGCLKVAKGDATYLLTATSLGKEMKVRDFRENVLKKKEEEIKITSRLLLIIKEIKTKDETLTSIEDIYSWLTQHKLSLLDSRALQIAANNINLKISSEMDFKCVNCEHETTLVLPSISNHFFGIDTKSYKENLDDAIEFLVFWGKMDYQSALKMPTYKRKRWCERTSENVRLLFTGK